MSLKRLFVLLVVGIGLGGAAGAYIGSQPMRILDKDDCENVVRVAEKLAGLVELLVPDRLK